MDAFLTSILPIALLESLALSPMGVLAVPLLLGLVTASLVAISLPGAVNAMSFVSGVVLGLGGIVVVALGVVAGSHLLFLASRRWLSARLQRRFGARIAMVQDHLGRRGALYVVGARLGGVPHVVVTAGCAATPISVRAFLGASLLGMLPSITISSMAGSALTAI